MCKFWLPSVVICNVVNSVEVQDMISLWRGSGRGGGGEKWNGKIYGGRGRRGRGGGKSKLRRQSFDEDKLVSDACSKVVAKVVAVETEKQKLSFDLL